MSDPHRVPTGSHRVPDPLGGHRVPGSPPYRGGTPTRDPVVPLTDANPRDPLGGHLPSRAEGPGG